MHGWYGLDVNEGPCTEQTFLLTAENPYAEYDEIRSFTHRYDNCASSSKDGKYAFNYYWNTPSDKNYVWIWFNLWRNASTGMGEHTCTGRTLAQMKKAVVAKCGSNTQDNLVQGWTCWSGNQTNGGGQTAAIMVNFNVEEQN